MCFRGDFKAFLPPYAVAFILPGKAYCPGLIVCDVVFGVDIGQKTSAPVGALAFGNDLFFYSKSAISCLNMAFDLFHQSRHFLLGKTDFFKLGAVILPQLLIRRDVPACLGD